MAENPILPNTKVGSKLKEILAEKDESLKEWRAKQAELRDLLNQVFTQMKESQAIERDTATKKSELETVAENLEQASIELEKLKAELAKHQGQLEETDKEKLKMDEIVSQLDSQINQKTVAREQTYQ